MSETLYGSGRLVLRYGYSCVEHLAGESALAQRPKDRKIGMFMRNFYSNGLFVARLILLTCIGTPAFPGSQVVFWLGAIPNYEPVPKVSQTSNHDRVWTRRPSSPQLLRIRPLMLWLGLPLLRNMMGPYPTLAWSPLDLDGSRIMKHIINDIFALR